MDTGYPALIAELPSQEQNLKIPARPRTSGSKNPPATPKIPEETSSPPTDTTLS